MSRVVVVKYDGCGNESRIDAEHGADLDCSICVYTASRPDAACAGFAHFEFCSVTCLVTNVARAMTDARATQGEVGEGNAAHFPAVRRLRPVRES